MAGRVPDSFEEYVRETAPQSFEDYMRYWRLYRDAITELRVEQLPCNSWVLKLASKYIKWLKLRRGVDETGKRWDYWELEAARLNLRLLVNECEKMRGVKLGIDDCPARLKQPDRPWARVLQEAILWSGSRLSHLYLLRNPKKIYDYGDVVVYRLDYIAGRKRVYIVPLPRELAEQVLEVTARIAYETAKGRVDSRCTRKYHYVLCLATGREQYCNFVHGRVSIDPDKRRLVSMVSEKHYDDLVERAVEVTRKIKPGVRAMLRGADYREAARLVERLNGFNDKPSSGIKDNTHSGALPQTQYPRVILGDVDVELFLGLSLHLNHL